MSLQYGLLGLLSYHESTGYDLTKMFEDSLNNFWHAQSAQIYRELKRMEDMSWVTSRSVIQDGRPNKRLYAITDKGRNELLKWLAEAKPEYENQHNVTLMKVFFGAEDTEATLALLKECRDQCKISLDTNCTDVRQNIKLYSSSLENGCDKSRYWLMTLELGNAMTKTMMEWAESCIAQIEKDNVPVPSGDAEATTGSVR